MPGFDKTGPAGEGPKTGRGYGPCGLGLGWRRKFGFRRGMGRYFGWAWPQSGEEQKKALEEYQKALEEELEDVKKEQQQLDKE